LFLVLFRLTIAFPCSIYGLWSALWYLQTVLCWEILGKLERYILISKWLPIYIGHWNLLKTGNTRQLHVISGVEFWSNKNISTLCLSILYIRTQSRSIYNSECRLFELIYFRHLVKVIFNRLNILILCRCSTKLYNWQYMFENTKWVIRSRKSEKDV
jgi:hypothetical protein